MKGALLHPRMPAGRKPVRAAPSSLEILLVHDQPTATHVRSHLERLYGVTLVHSWRALRGLELAAFDVIVAAETLANVPTAPWLRMARARSFSGVTALLTPHTGRRDLLALPPIGVDVVLAGASSLDGFVAQLEALGRRTRTEALSCGPLRIDPIRRRVFLAGHLLATLGSRELEVLTCLMRAQGSAVSQADLAEWVRSAPPSRVANIHVIICRLRAKLGASHFIVERVPGVGYRIADPGAPVAEARSRSSAG